MRLLSLIVVGAASVALTACQHTEPGVRVVYQDRPVSQPCLPLDQIPSEPAKVASLLTGNAEADLPIMAARALALLEWGESMHRSLTACAEDSHNPAAQ